MCLAIPVYFYGSEIADGYMVFAIAAPIAGFLTGGIIWKLTLKNGFDTINIISTGFLTGTISHYITFVLAGLGMNICYMTTGGCTKSLGLSPADILDVLHVSFALTMMSILLFGWITVTASIIFGLLLKLIHKFKRELP